MTKNIFLSYRRSDTSLSAAALRIVLMEMIPGSSVFVDVDSISPMERWPERLQEELKASSAVIALIGPDWKSEREGHARIDDEDDWVRQEIAYALTNLKGSVLPVFLGVEPAQIYKNLPADIEDLKNIQGILLPDGLTEKGSKDIALRMAKILDTDVGNENSRFPKPNRLKANAPLVSQAEFDDLKRREDFLDGWTYSATTVVDKGDPTMGFQIEKRYLFDDFKRAIYFLAEASAYAVNRDHHPDWDNTWKVVNVRLRTFDRKHKVTWYDLDMALRFDEIAGSVPPVEQINWPLVPDR